MEDITYEPIELPKAEHKMPETTLIELQAWVEPEQVSSVMAIFDTNSDGSISAQEAKANDAHESLFQVLTKLGVEPDALALALGIEPKAVREKRQAEDRAERDRMRKDWENGQKFDAAERERIKKEIPAPAPVPAPVPVPVDAGKVTVKLVTQEPKRLVIDYTNGTKAAVTLRIRVGNTERPDRLVAAGKTSTSTYTTTVAAGFSGQTITVTHAETGALIHTAKL
jgi:hypothetical protein